MIKFKTEEELITEIELEEFEQKLNGLKLPEDYKQHMLKYNGSWTEERYSFKGDGEHVFSSFHPIKYGSSTMENGLIAREDVLPESDIYIGYTVTGLLCMSLGKNHGAIYAFFSDGERIDLASSFTEFVEGLVLSEEDY